MKETLKEESGILCSGPSSRTNLPHLGQKPSYPGASSFSSVKCGNWSKLVFSEGSTMHFFVGMILLGSHSSRLKDVRCF